MPLVAPKPRRREPDVLPRVDAARARTLERRRREQHFRRRRRDLLEDGAAALVLSILTLSLSAGLGVVALIMVPLGGALTASFVLERRRRRHSGSRRRARSPVRAASRRRPASPVRAASRRRPASPVRAASRSAAPRMR